MIDIFAVSGHYLLSDDEFNDPFEPGSSVSVGYVAQMSISCGFLMLSVMNGLMSV